MVRRALSSAWGDPRARGLDLDSAEATEAHARILRDKPFLGKLYERYYAEFERAHREAPTGLRVELGSGAGFLDRIIPGVVRVDLRPGAAIDLAASALAMPFAGGSVGALFMLNVLHHLPDVEAFFGELARVLAPGGRAMLVEPYVSPLSRIVYRYGHQEPFDPSRSEWRLGDSGVMTSADDALPWIVFCRDRTRFEALFSDLEIVRVRPHTIALYALSGGFAFRSLAPGSLFPAIAAAEGFVEKLPGARFLASMMTVELASRAFEGAAR
jgi:SAM-dependent methyltransferase